MKARPEPQKNLREEVGGGGGGSTTEKSNLQKKFILRRQPNTYTGHQQKIRITFYYVESNYMYPAGAIKEMIDVSVRFILQSWNTIHSTCAF